MLWRLLHPLYMTSDFVPLALLTSKVCSLHFGCQAERVNCEPRKHFLNSVYNPKLSNSYNIDINTCLFCGSWMIRHCLLKGLLTYYFPACIKDHSIIHKVLALSTTALSVLRSLDKSAILKNTTNENQLQAVEQDRKHHQDLRQQLKNKLMNWASVTFQCWLISCNDCSFCDMVW